MSRSNLSEWALEHRSLLWYFMIVFVLAGTFLLHQPRARGRPELHHQDHDRPGQLARRDGRGRDQAGHRADREKAGGAEIARLHQDDHHSRPDHRLRQSAADHQGARRPADLGARSQHDSRHQGPVPAAASQGPFFNDRFGDVFGNIYAFTADGADPAPTARSGRGRAIAGADRAERSAASICSARRTKWSFSNSRPGRSRRSASTCRPCANAGRAKRRHRRPASSRRDRSGSPFASAAVHVRRQPSRRQSARQRPLLSADRYRDDPARLCRSADSPVPLSTASRPSASPSA